MCPLNWLGLIVFVNEQLESTERLLFSLCFCFRFVFHSVAHSRRCYSTATASLKEVKLKLQNFHLFILTFRSGLIDPDQEKKKTHIYTQMNKYAVRMNSESGKLHRLTN